MFKSCITQCDAKIARCSKLPYMGLICKFLRKYGRRIAVYSFFLLPLYFIMRWVHQETYVFQSTTVADTFFPAKRVECPLFVDDVLGPALFTPHQDEAKLSGFDYSGKARNKNEEEVLNPLRIGILMLYDDASAKSGGKNKDSSWSDEMMTKVIENRIQYARKYGYVPILANEVIDDIRPSAWSKFLAVQRYLPEFDYVMYIDMDAVIMNFAIPIETFISKAGPCSDIIMSEDWNGPNSGVWLVKNTPWSQWFFQHAWELGTPLVQKRSERSGKKHPFEYEQRVLHYLLESNIWRERGLSKYRAPGASDDVRAHFAVLPQCAFNSYSLHPLDQRGLPNDLSRYVGPQSALEGSKGDFIVHFAGKKGVVKTRLMEYYLALAASLPWNEYNRK